MKGAPAPSLGRVDVLVVDESKDYVGEVRRMLLAPACVRSRFTPADERLAQDLNQRGISLEQFQRAIWL